MFNIYRAYLGTIATFCTAFNVSIPLRNVLYIRNRSTIIVDRFICVILDIVTGVLHIGYIIAAHTHVTLFDDNVRIAVPFFRGDRDTSIR